MDYESEVEDDILPIFRRGEVDEPMKTFRVIVNLLFLGSWSLSALESLCLHYITVNSIGSLICAFSLFLQQYLKVFLYYLVKTGI